MQSLLQTVAALRTLLANLQHTCGWQPHKVSLLGFSQARLGAGWDDRRAGRGATLCDGSVVATKLQPKCLLGGSLRMHASGGNAHEL